MPLLRLEQRPLRLVFFGTPAIAGTILEALIRERPGEVLRVYAQPDRPKGRGKKLLPPATKIVAETNNIEVRQPKKLKDGQVRDELRALKLDLAIVVAYGRILPQEVFDAPRFGTWNVHASLLPRHRGASPIQHAILAGDRETGVTLMQLSEGLDEGDMLLKRTIAVAPDDTTETLGRKLSHLGSATLLEGLRLAQTEGLSPEPQNESEATFASLIEKKHGEISFDRTAEEIARQIRAFNPWPSSFVRLASGEPFKIIHADAVNEPSDYALQTKRGFLRINTVQPPGKRPMPVEDFARGQRMSAADFRTFLQP